MTKTAEFIRLSPNEKFAMDMQEIKKKLPKNWNDVFFKKFPQYNNHEGTKLVSNVFYSRTTDINVLECFKKLTTKKIK